MRNRCIINHMKNGKAAFIIRAIQPWEFLFYMAKYEFAIHGFGMR